MGSVIYAAKPKNVEAEIQAIIGKIGPTARQAKTLPICWVGGSDHCGEDYCSECVEIVAAEINGGNLDGEAFSDGGWDDKRESDNASACERCGCDLGYSLSRYGLEQELEYWLEDLPAPPLRPIDAYNIEAMLEAALYHPHPQVVADTLKVGRAAAVCIDDGRPTTTEAANQGGERNG